MRTDFGSGGLSVLHCSALTRTVVLNVLLVTCLLFRAISFISTDPPGLPVDFSTVWLLGIVLSQ